MLKALVFALWKKVKNLICDVDELNNEFDTHISNPNAHHTRYTDEDAVNAVDASNKFIERNTENNVSGYTTLVTDQTILEFLKFKVEKPGFMAGAPLYATLKSTDSTYAQMLGLIDFPKVYLEGTDYGKIIGSIYIVKEYGKIESRIRLRGVDSSGTERDFVIFDYDKIDIKNCTIKDIKNHDDATLSGTPKILEFNLGGTPYYVKVYPNKS